jgi:hypothetical protein
MLIKLGVVGVAAGLAGLVTLSQLRPAFGGFEMQALASLASLTSLSASAPAGASGPLDKTFSGRRVRLDKVVAQVELITSPAGPIRVQASGVADTMKELQVRIVGDEVFVRLDKDEDDAWFPWNLFNMWSRDRKAQDLKIRISAPSGTPYDMEDMSGSILAGDLDAPLHLEAHTLSARFGRVQSAKLAIAGGGKISLGVVKENLDLEIAGSGHVEAVSAAAAQVEIAGSGEVIVGPLSGGLSAQIAGAGNIRAASVNGPINVEIAGSGDVLVESGEATTFDIEIAGSGDVMFKGHAMNPSVDIMGSGNVTIGSYSGNLRQDISGRGSVKVLTPVPVPAPPAPPAHP